MSGKEITAGILIIGNEILSGRTLDTNSNHIAGELALRGIQVQEVRVVPDDEARIVGALNDLRARCTYVFTCGGIGPTHDDITAACIANAFDVPFVQNEGAMAAMKDYYESKGDEVTPARARMAMMPDGVELIANSVSGAPGFIIGNVYVMAGVPGIMKAMLAEVIDTHLEHGTVVLSRNVDVHMPESAISDQLRALQKRYPAVDIGSYPKMKEGEGWRVNVVFRGTDEAILESAEKDLLEMMVEIDARTVSRNP